MSQKKFSVILLVLLSLFGFGILSPAEAATSINMTPTVDTSRSFAPHWHKKFNAATLATSSSSHAAESKVLYAKFDATSGCDQVFMTDPTDSTHEEVLLTNSCDDADGDGSKEGYKIDPDWGIYFSSLVYDADSMTESASDGDGNTTTAETTIDGTWVIVYAKEMGEHQSEVCKDQGCRLYMKPLGPSLAASDIKANINTYPELRLTSPPYGASAGAYTYDRKPHMNFGTANQSAYIVFVRNDDANAANNYDMIYTLSFAPDRVISSGITENNITYRFSGNCSVPGLTFPSYESDDPQWFSDGYNIVFTVKDPTGSAYGGYKQIATARYDETGNNPPTWNYAYACGEDPESSSASTATQTSSIRIHTHSSNYDHEYPMPSPSMIASDTNSNQYGIIFNTKQGDSYTLGGFAVWQDLDPSSNFYLQLTNWNLEEALSDSTINRRHPVWAPFVANPKAPTWIAYEREDTASKYWEVWGTQIQLDPVQVAVALPDRGSGVEIVPPIGDSETGVLSTIIKPNTTLTNVGIKAPPATKSERKVYLYADGIKYPFYEQTSSKVKTVAEQFYHNVQSGKFKYQKTEATYMDSTGVKSSSAIYSTKALNRVLLSQKDPSNFVLMMLPENTFSLLEPSWLERNVPIIPKAYAADGIPKVMALSYATDEEVQFTTYDCGQNDFWPEFAQRYNTSNGTTSVSFDGATDIAHGRQVMYPSSDYDHQIMQVADTPNAASAFAGECGETEDSCEAHGYTTYDSGDLGSDTDLDGLPDPCDPCDDTDLTITTPDSTGYDYDTNGDGVNDACAPVTTTDCTDLGYSVVHEEWTAYPTTDTDGDGVPNMCDICIDDPSAMTEYPYDSDGDGVGDTCAESTGCECCCCCDGESCTEETEAETTGTDSCTANADGSAITDSDGDGLRDDNLSDGTVCDNCPTISNDDQEDNDGDGTGDACEAAAAVTAAVCSSSLNGVVLTVNQVLQLREMEDGGSFTFTTSDGVEATVTKTSDNPNFEYMDTNGDYFTLEYSDSQYALKQLNTTTGEECAATSGGVTFGGAGCTCNLDGDRPLAKGFSLQLFILVFLALLPLIATLRARWYLNRPSRSLRSR